MRSCQFERHAQANVGGVALQVYRGTCCGSCYHRDQACANRLPNGNAEMQRENRREQNAAANSGKRAEQAGKESKDDQKCGYQGMQLPSHADLFDGDY